MSTNNGATVLYSGNVNRGEKRGRGRPKGARNKIKSPSQRRWNEQYLDGQHRNMNCYICGTTLFVHKKIAGSIEASKVQLRVEMIAHIRANHSGKDAAKLLKKFGADVMPTMPAPNAPMVAPKVETPVRKEAPKAVAPKGKRYHKSLNVALRRIKAGFNNLMLVGPAGSGKSTLAEQVADELNLPYGFISLTAGATEGQLMGRLTSDGRYVESEFVHIFENGGVFLLDEWDGADSNMLLVLNAALANGHMAVPNRAKKPQAKRHKNCYIFAAGNTWGTGADWEYVGRNQLDASSLSRFACATLEITYDEELEKFLTSDVPELFEAFMKVRTSANANKVRRILGTRELLACRLCVLAGFTMAETWEALTVGWTDDNRRKAAIPTAA